MSDFKHLFENTYYSLLDSKEVAELEEIFLDEPLFQACSSELYNRSYDSKLTPAEIWYIAECFCIELGRKQKLMNTYYPIMLNRLIQTTHTLYSGDFAFYPHQGDMQTIIACIDIMLRCSLGEKQSKAISRIVRESMKPFYYQDAMSMISSGGIEQNVLHILQMPIETSSEFTQENYLEPRPWMLGQEASTRDEPVAEAPGQAIAIEQQLAELRRDNEQLQAENERLRNRVSQQDIDIEGYRTKEKAMSATELAIFVTAFCHYNGGLPANGRKSLTPVIQALGGYTEKTAVRALGNDFTQKLTEKVSSAFGQLSPKVARMIEELPAELHAIESERLRKLGAVDKVKEP